MKIAVLIGLGPNNIKIVSMVFKDIEEGLNTMRKINSGLVWTENQDKNGFSARIDEDDPTINKLYTSYYSGCGGVYSLVLKEIETGIPFVPFNLD